MSLTDRSSATIAPDFDLTDRGEALVKPLLAARRAVGFAVLLLLVSVGAVTAIGRFRSQQLAAPIVRDRGVWWPRTVTTSFIANALTDAGRRTPDSVDRGVTAAALLERSGRTRSTTDLLDAAELLASMASDPASACNRPIAWELLGLSHRAMALSSRCPAGVESPATFVAERWRGKWISANDLPFGEERLVADLLSKGEEGRATARIRRRAQAWRTYLEREGLLGWAARVGDADALIAFERRLSLLAAAYSRAARNPAPARLVRELSEVPAEDAARVAQGLRDWVEGARRLSMLEPEESERKLLAARTATEDLLPALQPLIALTLAGTRFHLGDHAGLGARAVALRQTVSSEREPWAVARCLWYEALALQASAEWELSARQARRAAEAYAALGEPANAGLLGVLEALDLESLNLEQQAEERYVAAIRDLVASDDTRTLATGLEALGRQQGRAGRPRLAIEIQREVLEHRLAEGNLPLILEARILLAEQLQQAGETSRARGLLEQVGPQLAAIPSGSRRARLDSFVDQVRGAIEVDANPEQAVARVTAFLAASDGFGERYQRAEALLQRARARVHLSDVAGAKSDLVLAVRETVAQSQRTQDATSAAALLNQARSTLEMLVELLLRTAGDGSDALAWIETLKVEQQYRSLGLEPPTTGLPRLPPGACATEYFALERRLLSWTVCGDGPPHLAAVAVDRDALVAEVDRLHLALRGSDRHSFRASVENLSRLLVRPIATYLNGATSWTVVPDAALTAVPFAWLEQSGVRLFTRLDVRVAPSLSELRVAKASRGMHWRALAVGNPAAGNSGPLDGPGLPAAEEEARAVAARFQGRALTGADATFPAAAAELRRFNLFHFAGHIYANQALPALSRLQFARDPVVPSGRVSAQEVAHADLASVDLAVLAGCASARDSGRALGGTAELSQAFLAAGAERVVGTLWEVEDRALGDAFEVFYAALGAGQGPAQALRTTWLAASAGDGRVDLLTAVGLQEVSNRIELRRRG